MSEQIVQAAEAVAAPLLKEAVAALTPEAEKVFTDVKTKLAEEADKLRADAPQMAEAAAQHVHDIAAAALARYQSVMDWVDEKLAGPAAAAAPGPTAAVPAPQTTQS